MPLDPRAIERGIPGLGQAANVGELDRRLSGTERRLALGAVPPYVTALPSSPRDNQEVELVAATDKLWHLRYQAAAARWRFIGGPALASGPAGAISMNSTTPTAPGGGPSITVPFTGGYRLEGGFYADIQTTGGVYQAYAFANLGGAGELGASNHRGYVTSRGGGGGAHITLPPGEVYTFTAGQVIDFRFAGTVGAVAYYAQDFWLELEPIYLA